MTALSVRTIAQPSARRPWANSSIFRLGPVTVKPTCVLRR